MRHGEASGGGGETDIATAAFQVLRRLARRGARIENGRLCNADGSAECDVAPATLTVIEAHGWLVPAGAGHVISRAGRTHLRRALSTSASAVTSQQPTRPGVSVPGESPLAWLVRRKGKAGKPLLDGLCFEAGERLRRDFLFGQMLPRTTQRWEGIAATMKGRRGVPGHGVELSDQVSAARERVRRALAAVGPDLAGILLHVCCHEQGLAEAERRGGWPQRSGKVVLQLALGALARHYGMVASARAGRPQVRHWGAENYRPTIDGDAVSPQTE